MRPLGPVVFESGLLDRYIKDVQRRFPKKTFGYFLGKSRFGDPVDYVIFDEDHRDTWLEDFHGYGKYYVDHQDAGFVASPAETVRVEMWIKDRGYEKVGVFHSHQRHPAILTSVDVDYHPSNDLWHLLLVLRTFDYPQVRLFRVEDDKSVAELEIVTNVASGADA